MNETIEIKSKTPRTVNETQEYICEKKIWDIIDRIDERLDVLSMNRSQLAQAMSVSRSAVSQFLSGHSGFNIKTLAKLSVAIDRDIDWLFSGSKWELSVEFIDGINSEVGFENVYCSESAVASDHAELPRTADWSCAA